MEEQLEISVSDFKKEIAAELEKEGKEYIEPCEWLEYWKNLCTDIGGEG